MDALRLLIKRTRNTDVIMVPAWMLLIERTRNTDVMVPAWMLLIERARNTDVIMVPAWMLLIKRTRNTDVIMVPAWMLLIKRTTNTDVFMPSASTSAMHAKGFMPCVVAAAFLSPGQVPKCCSCHAGQSRRAWARTHFLRVYSPSEPPTTRGHAVLHLQYSPEHFEILNLKMGVVTRSAYHHRVLNWSSASLFISAQ